jgi:hypothetical protein
MRGKFDPEHFGIERNAVAYTSAPAFANSIAYGGDGELDKPVAFLHDDLHRFRIDHPLFRRPIGGSRPSHCPGSIPALSLSIEPDAVERRPQYRGKRNCRTSSGPVGVSQKCHFRTHALQQMATTFDVFTCRWRNCPQHQSLITCSRQITRLDGAFECTDWTKPICSNVARWLARPERLLEGSGKSGLGTVIDQVGNLRKGRVGIAELLGDLHAPTGDVVHRRHADQMKRSASAEREDHPIMGGQSRKVTGGYWSAVGQERRRRLPVNFRYALLATEIARRCNMSRRARR